MAKQETSWGRCVPHPRSGSVAVGISAGGVGGQCPRIFRVTSMGKDGFASRGVGEGGGVGGGMMMRNGHGSRSTVLSPSDEQVGVEERLYRGLDAWTGYDSMYKRYDSRTEDAVQSLLDAWMSARSVRLYAASYSIGNNHHVSL